MTRVTAASAGLKGPAPRPAAAAAAFLVVAVLVAAFVGAADLNPLATAAALLDRPPVRSTCRPASSPLDRAVLFQIRLPRVVLGALVGGLLALAGAGYQGVFRNPLVDSGMLGASAGAGLGATLAIVYLGGAGAAGRPGRRVRRLARRGRGRLRAPAPPPAGAPCSATAWRRCCSPGSPSAASSPPCRRSSCSARRQDIQAVYSWLLGSLSAATWPQVTTILPYAAVSSAVILLHGRHLDVLAVGDEEARALGLRPGRVRLIVVAACALAAASAVAVSGLIGFVGIVVPHVARRLAGPSYRRVLPLSLLVGAGFLVLADTLARTVLSPRSCRSAWSPRWSARPPSSGSCAAPASVGT